MPPVRERPDDIIELAEYSPRDREFRPQRLSQATADALLAYLWPRNVRELEHVIERAMALADSDQLQLDDLPASLLDGYAEVCWRRRFDGSSRWDVGQPVSAHGV